MDRTYCVYMHTFPNGKKYVGITCQKPEKRWRKGRGYKQNIRLTRAFAKYGWENIAHVVLRSGLSQDSAEDMERCLISALGLMDESKGYNHAEGGTHPQHSEKTKEKIGKSSRGRKHTKEFKEWIGRYNSGSNNYMYGRKHSEETKRKISESKKGSVSPNKGKYGSNNPCSKSVVAVDATTGEPVKTFGSIIEAAQFTGRYPSGIQAVLNGKQRTSGGYYWRRLDG